MAVVVLQLPEGQAARWCARAMRASTRQSFLGNGEVGLRQALAHELPGDLKAEVASALAKVKALQEGVGGAGDAPAARRAGALQALREDGARLGRAPAVPDFSGRPQALRSIRRSFGGLRQATLVAGMVPARGGLTLTRAQLLELAAAAVRSSGSRRPALAVLERLSGLSRRQLKLAVREYFGSYQRLLLETGGHSPRGPAAGPSRAAHI
jgi:hypothetical protein